VVAAWREDPKEAILKDKLRTVAFILNALIGFWFFLDQLPAFHAPRLRILILPQSLK